MFQVEGSFQTGNIEAKWVGSDEKDSTVPRMFC